MQGARESSVHNTCLMYVEPVLTDSSRTAANPTIGIEAGQVVVKSVHDIGVYNVQPRRARSGGRTVLYDTSGMEVVQGAEELCLLRESVLNIALY